MVDTKGVTDLIGDIETSNVEETGCFEVDVIGIDKEVFGRIFEVRIKGTLGVEIKDAGDTVMFVPDEETDVCEDETIRDTEVKIIGVLEEYVWTISDVGNDDPEEEEETFWEVGLCVE